MLSVKVKIVEFNTTDVVFFFYIMLLKEGKGKKEFI